ncbi:nicotinate-nucleotide adenylyltransferase [Erwinia psidii]|uniref:Probable nicotinate-nucleotide adenylyltransferase n=1 Tax=Erwinia psidii TaxID=69224 RepID=A0A3N6SIT6_9GAMM|nr:nicotinate-nucleotide adenylyltransferase [Erwinia psidii]MCX8957119.1 nicotinate-nucleotide adenylyltransferase [Erwinia psidii]MCX8961771.1 nicotinate-nucleotide adenylyltransferase [Erwinia psidii]MCX8965365.1 nicotinate-nucleotide adenylyltransferase [Erwinia psidii]RQM37506.1 nicotinate-nucleotide adenylyltransferase [Erwinia psidii]
MSDHRRLQALFGGTFDPVHYGHLHPVRALAEQTGLQKITLMPNNIPPHRPQPEASPAQRVTMLELAIAGDPLFDIDLREMQRTTPSYTVETLAALRKERGKYQPLGFIIGQDSLLNLHQWYCWQELPDYCHLLVLKRPGYPETMQTPALEEWLQAHRTEDISRLHHSPSGCVFLAETSLLPVSATEIRARRHAGLPCEGLLPATVIEWIDQQGIYPAL